MSLLTSRDALSVGIANRQLESTFHQNWHKFSGTQCDQVRDNKIKEFLKNECYDLKDVNDLLEKLSGDNNLLSELSPENTLLLNRFLLTLNPYLADIYKQHQTNQTIPLIKLIQSLSEPSTLIEQIENHFPVETLSDSDNKLLGKCLDIRCRGACGVPFYLEQIKSENRETKTIPPNNIQTNINTSLNKPKPNSINNASPKYNWMWTWGIFVACMVCLTGFILKGLSEGLNQPSKTLKPKKKPLTPKSIKESYNDSTRDVRSINSKRLKKKVAA